jgi:magnesium chelatase subunit D
VHDASKSATFPFTAIVGQEEMKLSLLLCAINPKTGGVLIRGEKGTAKSTAVRAVASLLPEIPVVDVPLSSTEDMVLGGIDFARAVSAGERRFQTGLLARADGGILYIDEVNLLDDHLVDIILDSASSGIARVEREGICFTHAARFIPIGTMNPEEGELRAQLLDRFGLCVPVRAESSMEDRVSLMELRECFDRDAEGLRERYRRREEAEREKIRRARETLGDVRLPAPVRTFIAELSISHNVAGHRADLVMQQAAMALAAYEGVTTVAHRHVQAVSAMALRHRHRDAVPPRRQPARRPAPSDGGKLEDDGLQHGESGHPRGDYSVETALGEDQEGADRRAVKDGEGGDGDTVYGVGKAFKVRRIDQNRDHKPRKGSGRRSRTRTPQKQGRYVKSAPGTVNDDLALDATLRAAAPHQRARRIEIRETAFIIRPQDIHRKVRERRIGTFILFMVDASGSMGARSRMIAAKTAVLSLLMDAYQKRDTVAICTFRREHAEVLLPPTSSIETACALLERLPVGGRTPLSEGLAAGFRLLSSHLHKQPLARPIALLITDGRANVSLGTGNPQEEALRFASRMAAEERARYIVVDTGNTGVVNFGFARRLALALGADYFAIEELRAPDLIDIVEENRCTTYRE